MEIRLPPTPMLLLARLRGKIPASSFLKFSRRSQRSLVKRRAEMTPALTPLLKRQSLVLRRRRQSQGATAELARAAVAARQRAHRQLMTTIAVMMMQMAVPALTTTINGTTRAVESTRSSGRLLLTVALL